MKTVISAQFIKKTSVIYIAMILAFIILFLGWMYMDIPKENIDEEKLKEVISLQENKVEQRNKLMIENPDQYISADSIEDNLNRDIVISREDKYLYLDKGIIEPHVLDNGETGYY